MTATSPATGHADRASAAGPMILAHTRAELAAVRDGMSGYVAVVMTMGALHAGHEALLRAARERADHVIATVFVNPLQFGPNEDFDRYPRTLDADLELCRACGVDAVFAPAVPELYPHGEPAVRVNPGPLGERWEGATRPGFFHGVLTVVLKLLHLTRPAGAFFGEKDYQQLTLIRRMVADLDLPVEILGVPTVREPDGLALSSRNRYLSPAHRRAALALSAALRAGADSARRGDGPDGALAAARAAFATASEGTPAMASTASGAPASAVPDEPGPVVPGAAGPRLDYLALTDPDLGPAPQAGPGRLLVAAWVGDTRLIDNAPVLLAQQSTIDRE